MTFRTVFVEESRTMSVTVREMLEAVNLHPDAWQIDDISLGEIKEPVITFKIVPTKQRIIPKLRDKAPFKSDLVDPGF